MAARNTPQTDTEKLEQRHRELVILHTIAESLNAEVDLERALNTTLAKVVELFDLHTGWIWLLNEDTRVPYLAAVLNLPPALTDVPERMDGSAYCYCLDHYQKGGMSGASNVGIITCPRLKHLLEGTEGLRAHASVPLYAPKGKPLGMINVLSEDWAKLSEDDLRLLNTVGDLLSIAVERARLFQSSTRLGATEERNRLAREIHDTLAQGLTAITLRLESVDALLEHETVNEKVRDLVKQALALTRHNLEEARRSVLDLRAAPLQGRTLVEAIEALGRSATEQADLRLDFAGGEHRPLPLRTEAGLYRIAQESINNVIQHANAQELSIQFMTTPERIELVIADDGQGFDTNHKPEDCYGLIGINERVKLLGGTMTLRTEPGAGTCIEIVVPLVNEEKANHDTDSI